MTPAEPEQRAPSVEPAELVRRILAGEREAERQMVERYSRGIGFLLRHLARDPAQAEDLHQETFRLALEKVRAGELREPDKLGGFLSALARNLFLAEVRRSSRRPVVSGAGGTGGSDRAAEAEGHEAHDPAPGPLTRLLDKEDAALVRRLLAELEPQRDREILFRYFVAEHGKDEICADFGLSGLHFNRVLHRARQRLKGLVESHHKRQSLLPYQARSGAAANPGEMARRELHLESEEPPAARGAGPWTT